MIKKLLALALVIMSVSPLLAQKKEEMKKIPEFTVNQSTERVEYQGVVDVPGTQTELFRKAIMWLNGFFPNAQGATRVRDEINGKIVIVHRTKIVDKDKDGVEINAGLVEYTLTIDLKENKYRYTVTDIHQKTSSYQDLNKWVLTRSAKTDEYLIQVDAYIKDMIASLEKKMKEAQTSNKKDDW